MNKSHLKIFIDAASSNLDIYPSSTIENELKRIEELYEVVWASSDLHSKLNTQYEVKHYQHMLNKMCNSSSNYKKIDKAALKHDWHSVGKDFESAVEKAKRSASKDEAECWGF